MKMQTEKFFCKDCKHRFVKPSEWIFYITGMNPVFWSCRKSYQPSVEEIDPVTGPKMSKPKYWSCSSARIGRSREGNCGEDAFYWEPRDKRDLFKFIKKVGNDASKSE